MALLVGISGHKGSGKDTLAGFFVQATTGRHGPVSAGTTASFAGPINEHLCDLGIPSKNLYGDSHLREEMVKMVVGRPDAGRLFCDRVACSLGIFGDEKRERVVETYFDWWLEEISLAVKNDGFWSARRLLQTLGTEWGRSIDRGIWVKMALNEVDETKDTFFTDCRFISEAEAIKARGGFVVRVVRPGLVSTDPHQSEVEMDSEEFKKHVDFEIENSGQLHDLSDAAEHVLDVMRARRWRLEQIPPRLSTDQ